MDSFLMKGYIKEANIDYSCSRGSMEDLPKWEFREIPKVPRAVMPSLSLEERKNNFNEVELGLSEEVARKEARRCLKCGCSARFTSI